jgi:phage protein D
MTAFLQPVGRQPRGAVRLNGELITGWVEFEVENNTWYAADTFRCKFAGAMLPSDRNAIWFSQQQDMFVELFIGFPQDPTQFTSADLQSWIYGQVDHIEIDPVTNTIEVDGRDLTRVFIDTKTTQKWPNQTSSQIATALANAHGLTPVVTATTTLVGKYYEIDHVNMAEERSEWDILNYLADLEGFKVWVRGQSLYFQAPPDPTKTTPYSLVWQPTTSASGSPVANFEGIKLTRALTVSRGIQIKIKSWNKKYAKGFVVSYPSNVKTIKVGQSSVGSGAQIYSKTVKNLTQDQALQYAQNWYKQIVSHEMKIEGLTMPGDNGVDITSILQFGGTGTDFDQQYFPDCISRHMSFDGSYEMTISAKNHAPDSEVSL